MTGARCCRAKGDAGACHKDCFASAPPWSLLFEYFLFARLRLSVTYSDTHHIPPPYCCVDRPAPGPSQADPPAPPAQAHFDARTIHMRKQVITLTPQLQQALTTGAAFMFDA